MRPGSESGYLAILMLTLLLVLVLLLLLLLLPRVQSALLGSRKVTGEAGDPGWPESAL